jgi:hypothetical protein
MYDLLGSLIRDTNFDNVDKLRTLIQGVCEGGNDAFYATVKGESLFANIHYGQLRL